MLLLDADVMIDYERGHPPCRAWYASLSELPAVPGLVAMELIQDARNSRELRTARNLVAPLAVYWPAEEDCERALRDFAAFHLSHSLGLIDSLIAATAVGLGATLVTFNVKHYHAVPDLVTEQPYTR